MLRTIGPEDLFVTDGKVISLTGWIHVLVLLGSLSIQEVGRGPTQLYIYSIPGLSGHKESF